MRFMYGARYSIASMRVGPNRGWLHVPFRGLVWLLAAVYLGRVYYNNSLYDLKQRSVQFYVLKTLAFAVVGVFVYWQLVVVPPLFRALILTVVAFGTAMVFVFEVIIETGADHAEATDSLNRLQHTHSNGEPARMEAIRPAHLRDTNED